MTDRIDEGVVEIARIQVQEPDPVDPSGDGLDQGDDRALTLSLITPVRRQILGNEHDLTGLEHVDLGEDRLDRAAPLGAAKRRNGAETTVAVAALGDLHVGPRRGGRRSRELEEVEAGNRRLGADGDRHPEPDHGVDFWQSRGQLVAVALGHASRDDQLGAIAATLAEGENRVDRLLAGLVDERTGVDHHEIGGGRIGRRPHAIGRQRADQLVAVDLVLRTPQRLDPVRSWHPPRVSMRPGPAARGQPSSRSIT